MLKSKVSVRAKKNSSPNYLIRTQFAFRANDPLLNTILGRIADNGVSITGYAQIKQYHVNVVRMVVGPPNSISTKDTRTVHNILRSIRVPFREEKVLQILQTVPGTPGVIRSIFRALWRKVTVKAIYLGENTALFLNTNQLIRSIRILKRKNII